jgi:hypothetical protein
MTGYENAACSLDVETSNRPVCLDCVESGDPSAPVTECLNRCTQDCVATTTNVTKEDVKDDQQGVLETEQLCSRCNASGHARGRIFRRVCWWLNDLPDNLHQKISQASYTIGISCSTSFLLLLHSVLI